MTDTNDQKPSRLSREQIQAQRDALRIKKKYRLNPEQCVIFLDATTENTFPRVAALLLRGRSRPRWPGPDQAYDGVAMLDKVFYRIFRLPEHKDHCEYSCGVQLWICANRDLKAESRPTWAAAEWERRWKLAVDDLGEEQDEAFVDKPGRKQTQMTLEVARIRCTLNVSKSRAYEIYGCGTAIMDQRVKLAEEFRHDPAYNYPGAWELDFGRSHGGSRRASTAFRDYVLSESDDFEDDVCAALAVLKPAYTRGELPPSFADFRTFVDTMASLDIALKVALRLWDQANDYGMRHRGGN